ncbi:hypothetical protein D3C80_2083310 [compost metagenome]
MWLMNSCLAISWLFLPLARFCSTASSRSERHSNNWLSLASPGCDVPGRCTVLGNRL